MGQGSLSRDWFITLMERYCQLGCLLPNPDTFDVDDLVALAEHRLTPDRGFLLHLSGFLLHLRCLSNNSFQWKLQPARSGPNCQGRSIELQGDVLPSSSR